MEGVAYLAGFYTVMILKFYILFTRRVLFFFFPKHISMKNCGHLLVETNSLASNLSYVCIYTSFVELSSCLIVGCLVVCFLCTSSALEAVTDKKKADSIGMLYS